MNGLPRWAWVCATAVALVPGGAAALLLLATDAAPAVAQASAFEPAGIERALHILRSHDPRRQRTGVVRALALQQHDVEMLLQHAATRVPGLTAGVDLHANRAELRLSLPAPWPLQGRWLNSELEFGNGPGLPPVLRWRVGRVPLPAGAAWPLLLRGVERQLALSDAAVLAGVLRGVDFRAGRMMVFYAWQEDTTDRLRAALLPSTEQQRLRAYHEHLAHVLGADGQARSRSLADLIAPMFSLARERSSSAGSALSENRAALLTLTLYATGVPLSTLVPAAAKWPQARPTVVTLAGREDLPLHYLISATLALDAGSPVAEAVGVYKEIADTRGGTGFSFTDLLADRAGTRLANLALTDPAAVQQRLATVRSEADLLPSLHGLPDSLTAADLRRRFGGVGAPEYQRLLADIDHRLAATPTLR